MLIRLFALGLGALLAVPASADLRTMGRDYRQMKTNYHILRGVRKQCPELSLPSLVPGHKVDKILQDKLGIEQFMQVQIAIQQSDLHKNAAAVTQQLMDSVDGCDDPRLGVSMERLEQVHSEAFARLKEEIPLAKPKDVPVPLRRQ